NCPHCGHQQWFRPDQFGKVATCGRCARPLAVGHHIPLPCPQCGETLRVKPKHFGRTVCCRFCEASFPLGTTMSVSCPGGRRDLRVSVEHVGRSLRCKFCSAPFHVGPSEGAVLAAVVSVSETDVPAAIPKDNRPRWVAGLENRLQAANERI